MYHSTTESQIILGPVSKTGPVCSVDQLDINQVATADSVFKDSSRCREENGWKAVAEAGRPPRRLLQPLRNEMMLDHTQTVWQVAERWARQE